ncbi:HdeA/HdeB family chaperone [Thiohalocapsa marina]|nr:HdeA/HdeB family chaperone [Thiohalocapsa marina]
MRSVSRPDRARLRSAGAVILTLSLLGCAAQPERERPLPAALGPEAEIPGILPSMLAFGTTQSAEQTSAKEADFTQTTCQDLTRQSDEERAFALIFYDGYLAGRANTTTIDDTGVSEQLQRVREACTANPQSRVIDAFTAALR